MENLIQELILDSIGLYILIIFIHVFVITSFGMLTIKFWKSFNKYEIKKSEGNSGGISNDEKKELLISLGIFVLIIILFILFA